MRYIKYCLYFVLLIVSGCTYHVRNPQFSIAIKTNSVDQAKLLRNFIAVFSQSKGFNRKEGIGNASQLEQSGMYFQSYSSADDSLITITNIVGGNCYDISVYSTTGNADAQARGVQLRSALLEEKFTDSQIREQACEGTHKTN